jgi:hypothetical protein
MMRCLIENHHFQLRGFSCHQGINRLHQLCYPTLNEIKGNQLLLPMSWNLAVKLCTGVTNNFRNEGKFWVVTYCFAGLF